MKLFLFKTVRSLQFEYASFGWGLNAGAIVGALKAVQNISVHFRVSDFHPSSCVSSVKYSLFLPIVCLRRKTIFCASVNIHFTTMVLKAELLLEFLFFFFFFAVFFFLIKS